MTTCLNNLSLPSVVRRLLALAAAFVMISPAATAADPAVEYRLKAAYLYNFTKFVEWPAPRSAENPFIVGVLDPEGTAAATIAETLRGKSTPDGRPIEVRSFTAVGPGLAACHQLFLTRNSGVTPAQARAALGDTAVLIVGETAGFAESGGVINLVVAGDAVRCEINLAGATRSGVKLSGRLASVARLVRETSRQ